MSKVAKCSEGQVTYPGSQGLGKSGAVLVLPLVGRELGKLAPFLLTPSRQEEEEVKCSGA